MMKVYHCTSVTAAAAIERDGFQDRTGHYLTEAEHSGVWVSDGPLSENEGVDDPSVVFEIDLDELAVQDFEWIEEGKPYREWLIPAAMLNPAPRRRVEECGVDDRQVMRTQQPPSDRPYAVRIADNFHPYDMDDVDEAGRFATLDEAIEACRRITMESLQHLCKPGMTAAELYDRYTSFGDAPGIVGPGLDEPPFRARAFAKSAATLVAQKQKIIDTQLSLEFGAQQAAQVVSAREQK